MTVQIGGKEQIAQWTVLDTDARNSGLHLSEVIDGMELVIALRNIYSPNLNNYRIEAVTRMEPNKTVVDLKILVPCEYPNKLWLSKDYKICELRSKDDILTTYSIAFFVSNLLEHSPATSCLYHFFLYKKTETLPPINQ